MFFTTLPSSPGSSLTAETVCLPPVKFPACPAFVEIMNNTADQETVVESLTASPYVGGPGVVEPLPISNVASSDVVGPEVVEPLPNSSTEKLCQWAFDIGTGHAVTLAPTMVIALTQSATLINTFAPLLRGGKTIKVLPSVNDIVVKLESLELLFNPRSSEKTANDLCADLPLSRPKWSVVTSTLSTD